MWRNSEVHLQPLLLAQEVSVREQLLKANFLSAFSSSMLVEKVMISMSLMGREEMQKNFLND